MRNRTYSELSRLDTFEDRFDYLSLSGIVGRPTFGFDRYLNQRFYTSSEWRNIRNHVISRDMGLDLGIEGYEIYDKILVHHMNPMTVDNLIHDDITILDPEFLISTSHMTHNAIHYGDRKKLRPTTIERRPGDTKLW